MSDWYVTNKRIIQFTNQPFITNDTMFINISEIHQMEKKKRGFVSNIFDYGEVIINVAAVPEPIKLCNLPHPSRFINVIEAIRSNKLSEVVDPEHLKKRFGRHFRFILKK